MPLRYRVLFAIFVALMHCGAQAREIKVGVGNFPPYFSEKGTDGLFNELIREIFALMPQYQLTLVPQMSNYRLVHSLQDGSVDGAANIFPNVDVEGCRSDPAFRFADVAVTRKDQHMAIDSVSDLANKKIVTYQGARVLLGDAFAQVTRGNADLYREVPQPLDQARALALGQADVSVGDMYIFLYSLKDWSNVQFKADQFEMHKLFPDSYTFMGFREQKLCDDFNTALHTLKKTGKYEAVYARYLKQLQ